jgi:hypothetical protein
MSKIVCYRALAQKVLCVLVERFDGWCVYVDAVAGMNHRAEAQAVMESGAKMEPAVAEVIFGGSTEDFAKRGLHYVL